MLKLPGSQITPGTLGLASMDLATVVWIWLESSSVEPLITLDAFFFQAPSVHHLDRDILLFESVPIKAAIAKRKKVINLGILFFVKSFFSFSFHFRIFKHWRRFN